MKPRHLVYPLLLMFLALTGCQNPAVVANPVLIGAGDIASCSNDNDEATAKVVENFLKTANATVVILGDNAYETGTAKEYADCFNPTWGRFKSSIRPAPGNHDYYTANAQPYYDYFGPQAGEVGKGYYSYDLGSWHIVVLNSNDECTIVACNTGSAQEQWLKADLAAHKTTCTLAYWHHPRFSSGAHGNDANMQALWLALYQAGADVILNGHEHNYERFAPQDPTGTADPSKGMREFVVGTGGKDLRPKATPAANSEAWNSDTFGVLKLTLKAGGYDWAFMPIAGQSFSDNGSANCH